MPILTISADVSDILRAIKREQLPDPVNRRKYIGKDQFGNECRIQLDIGLRADLAVCLVLRNISVIGFVDNMKYGMLLAYNGLGEDKCEFRGVFTDGVATLGMAAEENILCIAVQEAYRLELQLLPEVSGEELEKRARRADRRTEHAA